MERNIWDMNSLRFVTNSSVNLPLFAVESETVTFTDTTSTTLALFSVGFADKDFFKGTQPAGFMIPKK